MSNTHQENLTLFANSICREIEPAFRKALRIFAIYNSDTIFQYTEEFNLFVNYIHKSSGKIHNLIISEFTGDKKFPYTTSNFEFKLTIKEDLGFDFDLKLIRSHKKHVNPGFLKNKIRPLYGYVYILKSEFGYKIGKTKNLSDRMSTFSLILPFKFEVHSTIKCREFNSLEVLFHKSLEHKRINGEWFNLSDDDFKDIDTILSNMKLTRTLNNG